MALPASDPAALLAHDVRLRALARALVRDADMADDLAQDTWLTALRRRAPIASLPGFAAEVARRLAGRARRSASRRRRREEVAARPEAAPSAVEILEREDTRRRVVEALLALDEPFRTTLVLRFLEDLPPRAVARRMSVPLETVRSRARRGLSELRARLDGEFGTRERWLAGLFPLLRAPAHVLSLVLMTKLAVVLLVSLSVWFLWPRSEPSSVSGASTSVSAADPAPPALVEEALVLARAAGATSGERVPTVISPPDPAPAYADSGALRVRVVVHHVSPGHAMDVNPLVGVRVRVTSDELENPDLHAFEAVTDAEGFARFEGLPAGDARVAVDRKFADPVPAALRAGATLEMEIALLEGFTIAGRVTDEADRAVAGAEIWLGKFADLANGVCVARSGPDGAFRLSGLGHANLGARARGFRPSKIAYFHAASGAEVEAHLVLRAGGGAVSGAVVGPSGEAVPGALVRVGPAGPASSSLELVRDADWGGLARTDADGRFELGGLASGSSPVLVRCAGYALFRSTIDVPAGGTATFTAALAREAALAGRVREGSGAPVVGALVCVDTDPAGAASGPFRACARTRGDGTFRVGALEAAVRLAAWIEDGPGSVRTELTLAAGETRTWEVVLDGLGDIHGRVVDARGDPLVGWSVRLEDEGGPASVPDQGLVPAGADGGFAFTRVHDRPHRVSVAAPEAAFASSLVLSGVRPGPDELVLCVPDGTRPSARVVGRFLDEEGRALPNAQIMPMTLGSPRWAIETSAPGTGAFDLGPFAAGPMRLLLRAPERGTIVLEHDLVAGETWDVGDVRPVPEGRVRVRLVPDGVEPDARLRFSVEPGIHDPFAGEGDERLSPPLVPRAYVLQVRGGDVEELAFAFEIRAGDETALDVPLRRGWRVPVAARVPATVQLVYLRVPLPGGAPLERKLYRREGELLVETLRLPAGTFPVEARAYGPGGSERMTSGTLVVEPMDREEPALVLALD